MRKHKTLTMDTHCGHGKKPWSHCFTWRWKKTTSAESAFLIIRGTFACVRCPTGIRELNAIHENPVSFKHGLGTFGLWTQRWHLAHASVLYPQGLVYCGRVDLRTESGLRPPEITADHNRSRCWCERSTGRPVCCHDTSLSMARIAS